MNSLTFFSSFLLCLWCSVSLAQPQRLPPGPFTPNGDIRPTIPKWYMTSAGLNSSAVEVPVTAYRRFEFCGTDYPQGYSFRCETTTGPDFPTVTFRVNAVVYRKEYFAPYYISGNTLAGIIRPFPYGDFKQRTANPRIRIACRVRTRAPVWVDIFDTCQ